VNIEGVLDRMRGNRGLCSTGVHLFGFRPDAAGPPERAAPRFPVAFVRPQAVPDAKAQGERDGPLAVPTRFGSGLLVLTNSWHQPLGLISP
jgi:hypothetical protein